MTIRIFVFLLVRNEHFIETVSARHLDLAVFIEGESSVFCKRELRICEGTIPFRSNHFFQRVLTSKESDRNSAIDNRRPNHSLNILTVFINDLKTSTRKRLIILIYFPELKNKLRNNHLECDGLVRVIFCDMDCDRLCASIRLCNSSMIVTLIGDVFSFIDALKHRELIHPFGNIRSLQRNIHMSSARICTIFHLERRESRRNHFRVVMPFNKLCQRNILAIVKALIADLIVNS